MSNVLSQSWWNGVSSIALILTLLFIAWYTWLTYRLLGFQRRPVVLFTQNPRAEKRSKYEFYTWVSNVGLVHAKARFKVVFFCKGQSFEFPRTHPYGGQTTWPIHASGTVEFGFPGNLTLPEFAESLGITLSEESLGDAWLRIDSRAIAANERNWKFRLGASVAPTLFWKWNGTSWIQDMNPPEEFLTAGSDVDWLTALGQFFERPVGG